MPATISKLLKLLKDAEKLLVDAGQKDPLTRVTTLRGIYYGTSWSLDYKTEKSKVRSFGFYFFTGMQDPVDPRPILGDKLFKDLQNGQDLVDGNLKLDFGHLLIGLDARKEKSSRTYNIPKMGGTGLEIVTWLGDLGGGAANLAYNRLTNPKMSVQHVFNDKTSDYGASINLEGDIAAYVSAIQFPVPGETYISTSITREMEKYLPLQNKNLWNKRAHFFLLGIGGKFQQDRLSNRLDLKRNLADKIKDFAAYYFSQRYILEGKVNNQKISKVCTMLPGVAFEVASVFVDALIYCLANPGKPLSGRPPYPPILAPATSCDIGLLKIAMKARDTGEFIEDLGKFTRGALKDAFKAIDL